MNSNQQISILQYNLNRRRFTTQSFLNHPNSKKLAILAVQEQYCSSRTKKSLPHQSWTIIETPSQEPGKKPRAAIYVNKRVLPEKSFQVLHYPSSDVAMIQLKKDDNGPPMLLINVYNTKGTSLINDLATFLQTHLQHHQYGEIGIVGDFNLHHPLWNPPGYDVHDNEAEDLVDLMAENGLDLMLPEGTITFPRCGTSLDLVWGNAEMENKVVKCKVALNHDHGSDHYAILTTLDMRPVRWEQKPMYDFEKMNWEHLKSELAELLPPVDHIATGESSPERIDRLAEDITNALTTAIEHSTPRRRICPFSKRWWTDELTKARRETNKARNRFKRTGDEIQGELWKRKEKEYRGKIKKAKKITWRKFVKEADEKTIWKLKKYMDSDTPTSSYITTLNGTVSSNDEKVEIFKSTFFPLPPPADLSDIEGADYPDPVPSPPRITLSQLETAIQKLAAKKAPGPDEIPNLVLKKCYNELKNHLLILAQESFEAGHFPSIFKESTTLVIRKPKKPDYTRPNAYRPIALERTIGKVLESIIAETISYLTETYELLPSNHFGGRPCRSTEDAMMLLMENIYDTWGDQKVMSALFMDVAGAFNNVVHQRLIHDLRKRRIPETITRWIASSLLDRSTRICFNGIESETSLPQQGYLRDHHSRQSFTSITTQTLSTSHTTPTT